MESEGEYAAIERRMEIFVLVSGAAIAAASLAGWGWRAGLSAAAGLLLCWLNFRWLRAGAAAVVQLGAAQAEASKVTVPSGVHAKFLGRLVLLLGATYAILAWLRLPALEFVCGLTAVVPAIVLELGYELVHGHHRWTHSKSDS
ncbi:MAG: ATP synthase subunit I [Candidatus Acidiferrales bacterium]